MSEQRKNTRYKTIAHVCIHDVVERDALLKDLSITGCSIETTDPAPLTQGVVYSITIIPETVSKISKFELQAEARWIKTNKDSCEAGFMITASPLKKEFQRYVDYLVWRSASS